MGFRFLHLGDVHLETHFGGRPETRERLRRATMEAFGRAVDFAIEEELHAVLVAGDLFDDPLLSLATELQLVREVRRLTEAGCWFLYACGNHDPGAAGRRAAGLDLERPEIGHGRVHVFRRGRPRPVRVRDAHGREVGVVVGAGHETDHESANLAAGFPRLDTALPVVGLLHTQVESARAADQHDRYAPSTASDYAHPGYAYWALGHVHIRQQAVPDLPVWYSGNLQGRNAKERGAKGGLLVDAQAGGFATPELVAFAPVRWEELEIDDLAAVSSTAALADLLHEVADAERRRGEEELCVRFGLRGPSPLASRLRSPAARQELEEDLIARGACLDAHVDASGLRTPRDLDELRRTPSVLQAVLATLDEIRQPDLEGREALLAELATETSSAADADDRVAYLAGLLEGLEEELLERCFEEDGT